MQDSAVQYKSNAVIQQSSVMCFMHRLAGARRQMLQTTGQHAGLRHMPGHAQHETPEGPMAGANRFDEFGPHREACAQMLVHRARSVILEACKHAQLSRLTPCRVKLHVQCPGVRLLGHALLRCMRATLLSAACNPPKAEPVQSVLVHALNVQMQPAPVEQIWPSTCLACPRAESGAAQWHVRSPPYT